MPPKQASRAVCARQVANWSVFKPQHKFDKASFNKDAFTNDMSIASPKLVSLLNTIETLDAKDLKEHGTYFKHVIYSDIKTSNAGAKIIAAGFSAKGYPMIYDESMKLDTAAFSQDAFALLASTKVFGKDLGVQLRKSILQTYNDRPDNVHGQKFRFIILDSGFKEGIDLFDVKYIHIFEPATTPSDEKQIVGRGTRFCGQKGLEFHNEKGWPLFVYRYEVVIPDQKRSKYEARTLFEVYLKASGIDLRNIVLSNELERTSIKAAVDHNLTKPIHDADLLGDEMEWSPTRAIMGGKPKRHMPKPPQKLMTREKLEKYIDERYGHHSWPELKMENKCTDSKTDNRFVTLTPTQNFVRLYFRPSSVYKGLLLWHSVGTGKTCTAIAAATSSFEREGYSILWVTRHTLKADIWKNMFKQICSQVLKAQIKKGDEELPGDDIKAPMQILSDRWLQPVSYKQFSNLLLKKNKIYDEMVKRNGEEDPLKRTLIIIDEAHKLYAPDMNERERPDVNILQEMIHKSYMRSAKDSCKVLLMSATPFTSDPMNLIKLLNLLRPADALLPASLPEFASQFLDGDGKFTVGGQMLFMDKVAGYISYLNREKDARSFAYPVFRAIYVPMSLNTGAQGSDSNATASNLKQNLSDLQTEKLAVKQQQKVLKHKLKEELQEKTRACKAITNVTDRIRCKEAVAQEMEFKKINYTSELQQKMMNITRAIDDNKTAKGNLKRINQDAKKGNITQEYALDNCFKK